MDGAGMPPMMDNLYSGYYQGQMTGGPPPIGEA